MRLVEKKCPNCGGALKFNFEDKETTCEFCGRSFEIERDQNISQDNDEIFNAENYALTEEQKKVAKTVAGTFTVVPIIFGVIFLFAFGTVAYVGFKGFSENSSNSNNRIINNKSEEQKEKGLVIDFKELSEQQIKDIHENSLTILNRELDRLESFLQKHTKWTYLGMYLLHDSKSNQLYDIYTIKFNGKDFFAGVSYSGIKVLDGKLVMNMSGSMIGEQNFNSGTANTYGYQSAKELYNKWVRARVEKYTISTSGNVYNE